MKIGIVKEVEANETRVAAVPETVANLVKSDNSVIIEKDAGLASFIANTHYEQAGAKIESTAENVFQSIDILLKVNRPVNQDKHQEIDWLKENTILVAPLYPHRHKALLKDLIQKKITAFSLDLLPRIARAQSMDILSSMSNLAGYKSVLLAADHLPKIFPMLITAAGTIKPAKVIVIGAGVAGLQAIATARRLGAVVIGFDTRPVTEEQVKSLGADFVSMEVKHEEAQDQGGYAKEQSAAFYSQEQAILSQYIKEADVIITTALIPGKPAPLLITKEMVKNMLQGAVIVDLAAEAGGNCELSEPGKTVIKEGITLIAPFNIPSLIPINASQLFSKNIYNFLNYLLPQIKNGQFDLADEIVKQTLITHDGQIVNAALKA